MNFSFVNTKQMSASYYYWDLYNVIL